MARPKSGWNAARHRVLSRWLPAAAFLAVSWALPGRAAADWTIMVYLDGDNNLEPYAISDFLEMASVGGDSSVNVVVQFDRAPGYAGTYGNWETCKRFCVTIGTSPTVGDQVADIGEANMGDPTTLTNFINWAAADYPASRYALVLWNHGNGWMTKGDPKERPPRRPYKYVCDDETDADGLELREVADALDAANVNVDLVGFDACLMGMVEVAYELRDAGPTDAPEVVVFSEDLEYNYGWPYDEIITDLRADPAMTPTALGTVIVDRFGESFIPTGFTYTQSAVSMGELPNLGPAIDTLSYELVTNWSADPGSVKTAAQAVLDSLDSAVINEVHHEDYRGANGLTIYFPSLYVNLDPEYDAATLDFANDTAWGDFLNEFFTAPMTGSWVCDARRNVQEFGEDSYIDLYDFCDRLANHAIGAYYVDFDTVGLTGTAGTAQGWNADDGCWQIDPLPFTFTFFGQTYSKVWVCSNGFLDFGAAMPDPVAEAANSTEKLKNSVRIAPLWVDLDTSYGDIYLHSDTDALGDYLCVRWEAEGYLTAKPVEFEALLYADGHIKFNYGIADWWTADIPPVYYGLGFPPTVGVSAGDGEHWELSLYDHAWYLETDESDLYTPCAPEITSFDADKTTISYGETVTLTWVTVDMASVSIDNGVGAGLPLSGSAEVTPSQTVTYTLTAIDPLGNPHTQTVTVTVERLTLTYPVGGEVILGNQTVQVTWTSAEFTDPVRIEFWNGSGWSDIAASTANDGTEPWAVPDQDLPTWALTPNPPVCKVRASDAADGSPFAESAEFSILSDTDSDGMPDSWESHYSLDDPAGHSDGDTLVNLDEYLAGTDPTDEDTDDDLLLDSFEVDYGLDPLDDDSDGDTTLDGADNNDADLLTNLEEQTEGTDPTDPDTDGDDLPDHWETTAWQTAQGWLTPGLLDPLDAWSGRATTEPRDDAWDIDGDGYSNFSEYQYGYDPTDPFSPPPKGSTSSGGCAAGGEGAAGGPACLVLIFAAGLAAFRRSPVRAQEPAPR